MKVTCKLPPSFNFPLLLWFGWGLLNRPITCQWLVNVEFNPTAMDMLKCLNIVRFGFTIKVFLTALPMQKLRRNQRFLLPSFWVCYCLTDFVHPKTVTHLGFDDKRWTFVSPIATDHPRTNQSVRAKTPSLLENFIKVFQTNILCIKMQLNSLRFGSAL